MENTNRQKHGCFFKDGERRADYAIVINRGSLASLSSYIKKLQSMGLEFELAVGHRVPKLFLLIHIPEKTLKHFSKLFDVGNHEIHPGSHIEKVRKLSLLYSTPISHLEDKEMGTFTSAERILIIRKMMEQAGYGDGFADFNISKLIKHKIVDAAYPLHDGRSGETGKFDILDANDRQLMLYYWSNFSAWYKESPLDMINKYFGAEVAFYFAWVEFFNKMLVPAAIVGTLVFIVNTIQLLFPIYRIQETCEAHDTWICPRCEFHKKCIYTSLASFCTYASWGYVFDNYLTIAFAVFMSFWATLFICLWRRRQNILLLRWGIFFKAQDYNIRQEYIHVATMYKLNPASGILEPYVEKNVRYLRMAIAISVCIFMLFLVLAAVMGVMLIKINITIAMKTGEITYLKNNGKTIALVIGSILHVIFIKIFGQMYGKLSIWLTNFENPRTQHDYDSSVLHMRYLLAFANNYTTLFYIAFIKGRFFSLPHRFNFRTFERDTCQPSNCVATLCMQLGFIMLLKKLVGNILTLLIPKCKKALKRLYVQQEYEGSLSQYEEEYLLLPTNRYLLTTEFSEMVIEYGFVTFFVAAFPLAPLFALLNNLLETRLDAYKLVTRYRRPVPREVNGIGSWDGIITAVTYLSTATNAFVIAFTSDFVSREIYRYRNNYSLKGYVNSTLSVFATKDYNLFRGIPPNPDKCYYHTMRNPPNHPNRYQLSEDFWHDLMWRLICVLIFEYIIFGINGILTFTVPEIPYIVKQPLHLARRIVKIENLKKHNKELKQGKAKGTIVIRSEENPFRRRGGDTDRRPDEPSLPETGPIVQFITE